MYKAPMHLADYMDGKNPDGRKFSDEEIAHRIGRSRATVSRIRRGRVRPDWSTIRALEEMTGGLVTASDFTELPQPQGSASADRKTQNPSPVDTGDEAA
jgi:transcriptional regulator with XRE-family HTH domain